MRRVRVLPARSVAVTARAARLGAQPETKSLAASRSYPAAVHRATTCLTTERSRIRTVTPIQEPRQRRLESRGSSTVVAGCQSAEQGRVGRGVPGGSSPSRRPAVFGPAARPGGDTEHRRTPLALAARSHASRTMGRPDRHAGSASPQRLCCRPTPVPPPPRRCRLRRRRRSPAQRRAAGDRDAGSAEAQVGTPGSRETPPPSGCRAFS